MWFSTTTQSFVCLSTMKKTKWFETYLSLSLWKPLQFTQNNTMIILFRKITHICPLQPTFPQTTTHTRGELVGDFPMFEKREERISEPPTKVCLGGGINTQTTARKDTFQATKHSCTWEKARCKCVISQSLCHVWRTGGLLLLRQVCCSRRQSGQRTFHKHIPLPICIMGLVFLLSFNIFLDCCSNTLFSNPPIVDMTGDGKGWFSSIQTLL